MVEVTEEEAEAPTKETDPSLCPGFDYFLEVCLIKDLVGALGNSSVYKSGALHIERMVRYIESDA